MQAQPAAQLLLWVVIPAWILAGALDWRCHRRTRIERNAGLLESLIHQLLFLELGLALALMVLFEATASVMAAAVLAWLAHEFTVWRELRMVSGLRVITPLEQQVHGALDMIPATGLLLVAINDWPIEAGGLRLRQPSPLAQPAAWMIAAGMAAVWLLYMEELWRCWKVQRAALAAARL